MGGGGERRRHADTGDLISRSTQRDDGADAGRSQRSGEGAKLVTVGNGDGMATTRYAIAVGSNRRGRRGDPRAAVRAAMGVLGGIASPIVASTPVGPSIRCYANAVVVIDSDLDPAAMLTRLKAIERAFGRRRGRRWGARTIDLDIVLWSGGTWTSRGLTVPHVAFRGRGFVLAPLAAVAPGWRDPITHRTVRQLYHRLTHARGRPSRGAHSVRARSSVGRATDF